MDVKKLTSLPESQTLEFKRNTSSLDSILRSVVSFANTNGGIILIGVEDDGSIIGIENSGKIQEQIACSIANRVKPQLIVDINTVEVDSKVVLVIQIEHMPGPYYLSDKGMDKGVYIRLGNSNRIAGTEAIDEMKRASHNPFFDKMPCDNVTEDDLDKKLIQKVFAKNFEIDTAKLISIGILTKKGKRIVATNGGVILFGKPEIRQEHFSFAEVRCARFEGTTRAEFIDRLNIEGGILAAIDEVPKFIRRNTKMAGKFGEMKRRDIPEYPVEGVREVLINALTHANYEIPGMRIFVAIYDDKLEIQNPGIMPPGMSIEQFKAGVSKIRNPVIARVFGELELVEEWGSGYKRIKEECQENGYPEPKWEELGSALRVTFYPHSELSAISGTKMALSRHQEDENLFKILDSCRNPLKLQEIMGITGYKDKTKFRNKYINKLISEELLSLTIPEKPRSKDQRYITTAKGIHLLSKRK